MVLVPTKKWALRGCSSKQTGRTQLTFLIFFSKCKHMVPCCVLSTFPPELLPPLSSCRITQHSYRPLQRSYHAVSCHDDMLYHVMSSSGSTHDRRHGCLSPVTGTGPGQPPSESAIVAESTVESIYCCVLLIPQCEALSAPKRSCVRRMYEAIADCKTSS